MKRLALALLLAGCAAPIAPRSAPAPRHANPYTSPERESPYVVGSYVEVTTRNALEKVKPAVTPADSTARPYPAPNCGDAVYLDGSSVLVTPECLGAWRNGARAVGDGF
jgi:hypothetical protein